MGQGELVVGQVGGVDVDEDGHVGRRRLHLLGGAGPRPGAQLVQAAQAAGGVDEVVGAQQGGLLGAQQRLVAHHLAPAPGDDRLEGDARGGHGRLEARLQAGPIAQGVPRLLHQVERQPAQAGQLVKADGPLEQLAQLLGRRPAW